MSGQVFGAVALTFALVAFVGSFWAEGARAAPDPVDVTVTIIRFIQVEDPDPFFGGGDGDFYARVNINDLGFESTFDEQVESDDFSPYWTFTRTVDGSLGTIPIVIQVLDDDFLNPDDIIDLNPIDGVLDLDLTFDLTEGTWSGAGIAPNAVYSRGDGDVEPLFIFEGGEAGAILFEVSLSSNGDLDGDGIPDGVERFGVRDADGNLIADMAALGADPCRKTVAVEVDYMETAEHSHQPTAEGVLSLPEIFNDAPVAAVSPCPYSGYPTEPAGVNLIIDVDDAITHEDDTTIGDVAAIRDVNFQPERRPYFHYALQVHNATHGGIDGVQGVCCSDQGDFISNGGKRTFMHELGHGLALGHGGGDGVNFKPNYLSVMNYLYEGIGLFFTTRDVGIVVDYSREALPDLDEATLDETAGISDGPVITAWLAGGRTERTGPGDEPLNWDASFPQIDEDPVSSDINGDAICVTPGADGVLDTLPDGDDILLRNGSVIGLMFEDSIRPGPNLICDTEAESADRTERPVGFAFPTLLSGHDDWANLKYRGIMAPTAAAVVIPPHRELTDDEAARIEEFWERSFSPDLEVTKTVDLADAIPGDTLTYEVTIENVGTGRATEVELVDTFPDGTTETHALDDLEAGQSATENFDFVVPFPISDLAELVNTVTVSGENLRGQPEENTSNNSDTASTVVHTPEPVLEKTATASVNAGGPITYTVTYENVGSRDALAVVIDDTLPAEVYYSPALDEGSGPAPDSVATNADGTTTLTWQIGTLVSDSGTSSIEYTARPSLLVSGGDTITNDASLDFTDANGNDYPALTTNATTMITTVPPGMDPKSLGFLSKHQDLLTDEILAMIQATDDRFEGADGTTPDGQLSASEVEAVASERGKQPAMLRLKLLTTYFNLATREINADTALDSRTANNLSLESVADAVVYARDTLDLPVTKANRARYDHATRVLDEINNDRRLVY